MIGDWMGSQYDVSGRRWDYHLFLDHDGRYEWMLRRQPDYEHREAGHWEYDEAQKTFNYSRRRPMSPKRGTTLGGCYP